MLGKCSVGTCDNTLDPRWFVHSPAGPLPACDGCGCEPAHPCRYCKSDKSPFDWATYYDCRDSEELTHSEPEEAIEEIVDMAYEKGVPIEETLADLGPVTVTAYNRRKASNEWIENQAEYMAGDLVERFEEEHGDPGGCHDAWTAKELKTIEEKLCAVIKEAVADAAVWQCEKVAEREYSEAEVTAIAKDLWPDEFKDGNS
jgi:hypothetical protein